MAPSKTAVNAWFQIIWPESWSAIHITVKELVPIGVACVIWGQEWQRRSCGNCAVWFVEAPTGDASITFFVAVFQL